MEINRIGTIFPITPRSRRRDEEEKTMNLKKNVETLYTTTTLSTFGRVRGFTVDLLFSLKNHELRTIDIVESSGKYRQYVNEYLYRMRKYGLVQKEGSYWKITENGVSFLSKLPNALPNTNTNTNTYLKRKHSENIRKHCENTSVPKKLKQLSFSLWLQDSGLSYDEITQNLVVVVLDHYHKTGSKFIYTDLYSLAEQFKVSPERMFTAILKLHEDHILYHYPSKAVRQDTFKLGAYKDFLQKLEFEKKIGSTSGGLKNE